MSFMQNRTLLNFPTRDALHLKPTHFLKNQKQPAQLQREPSDFDSDSDEPAALSTGSPKTKGGLPIEK